MFKCKNGCKTGILHFIMPGAPETKIIVEATTTHITGALLTEEGQTKFLHPDDFDNVVREVSLADNLICPECNGLCYFEKPSRVEKKAESGGLRPVVLELTPFIIKRIQVEKGIALTRIVEGVVLRETDKALLVRVHATIRNTITCLRCGRFLENPVSRLIGIGPVCCEKMGLPRPKFNELSPEELEYLKSLIQSIEFEGWLPKSQISGQRRDRYDFAISN